MTDQTKNSNGSTTITLKIYGQNSPFIEGSVDLEMPNGGCGCSISRSTGAVYGLIWNSCPLHLKSVGSLRYLLLAALVN